METATVLARDIQAAGDGARYDAAVKNLLADKMILGWILKTCTKEFSDISLKEIAGKYFAGDPQVSTTPVMPDEMTDFSPKIQGTGVEDMTVTEGSVTFDIRFDVIMPESGGKISMLVNVEAQNDFYPGYPLVKRGIYYCGRMISSQYGTVFIDSHYEKLKKVYSIWICTAPPMSRENTITEYSIKEKNLLGSVRELLGNYDLISVIMICLGNPERGRGITKLLGTLLSAEIEPQEKKRILETEFGIPMTMKLERQVLEMCNLSKGVFEQGIKQGIKQGTETALTGSIRNLMDKLKLTAEQAMDVLDIPKGEQAKYKAIL